MSSAARAHHRHAGYGVGGMAGARVCVVALRTRYRTLSGRFLNVCEWGGLAYICQQGHTMFLLVS